MMNLSDTITPSKWILVCQIISLHCKSWFVMYLYTRTSMYEINRKVYRTHLGFQLVAEMFDN